MPIPSFSRLAAAVSDLLGRPVQPRTLTERQTDGPMTLALHKTFGDHPVAGLTPERMAALLNGAETGDLTQQSELFLDMRDRDPHLDAEMGKRERAILTLPWSIEPPPNPSAREKRQAKAAAELLQAVPDLEDALLGMMDAAGHGFSCQEITWSPPAAGERLPERIEHRPQAWFRLDTAKRTELRLRDSTTEGAELWPMGWIVHRHAARSGYLWRAGLYRALAWPWIMRQFSLRDMAEWLEIYGLPMRLGYYRSGAEAGEKATLYRAVRDLGRHAAGIMPEGMRIELLAAAEGQADPFMRMVEHCEAVISRAIVGGSLSSTPAATGLGSGVADLQGEVKRDLLLSDARQVQSTLSRHLVWPICVLNGLGDDPRRAPVWRFDTHESADLSAFSESLERLTKAGMGPHIPVAWVQTQTGIPAPVEGEATLAPTAPEESAPNGSAGILPATGSPGVSPGVDAAAAMAALSSAGGRKPPSTSSAAASLATDAAAPMGPDYADTQTERLGALAAPLVLSWLKRIRSEVDTALIAGEDLADLRERLVRLYPELDGGELTAILSQALTAADLAGRYDLDRGQ